jgi:acyl-CoA reductase-like NAD-dependent aldehyde dehydrogenase
MNLPSSETTSSVRSAIERASQAQRTWSDQLPRERLRAVATVAREIAARQVQLVAANPRPNATPAEFIASELLPLADACRYTSRVGKRALAPTTHAMRNGAWWMGRIGVRVLRQPWGTVLILAPSNYPLFLPGVQIIQALAAGNAVLVKPAPGCTAVLHEFSKCLEAAGIPGDLVQIVEAAIEAGQAAIELGVNKVFLTGSVATGRAVSQQLSKVLVPSVMELSGCDAVFVTDRADLTRVVRCLSYALQLNGGATCIAPRRVFATAQQIDQLCEQLTRELNSPEPRRFVVPISVQQKMDTAIQAALAAGARIVHGHSPSMPTGVAEAPVTGPLVLRNVTPQMALAQDDFFGPVLLLISVPDMQAALAADRLCPYALGASVFGPSNVAEHWSQQVQAGCVVINDLIVPTADPRVAFGGWAQSGWGVTRGWDGLREMTRPQTLCTRYGGWLPHLNRQQSNNAEVMSGLLQLVHGGSFVTRWRALKNIVDGIRRSSGKS